MPWTQQCEHMKDSEFLFWLRDRLVCVYHESANTDFVYRLGQIAREVVAQELGDVDHSK